MSGPRRTIIQKVDPDPPEVTEELLDEKCCGNYPTPVPPCKKEVEIWRGYDEQEIKDMLGIGPHEKVKIEFVGGGRGGVCGKKTTEAYIPDKDCCEGVEEIVWDDANSATTMSPNSADMVYVIGGQANYIWKISGTGFSFSGGKKTIETSVPEVRVYADENACGYALVSVDDNCSKAEGGIKSTAGKWVAIGSIHPVTQYDPASNGYFLLTYNLYACDPGYNWYIDPPVKYSGKYRARHLSCTCGGALWTNCGGLRHQTIQDQVVKKFTVNVFRGQGEYSGVPWICNGGDYKWYCHSNTWTIEAWVC